MWVKVPYWDVVDIIEFEEPKKFVALRFGYYKLKDRKLRWASQATLTEPLEVYKKLFVNAAREIELFRNFLRTVLKKRLRHKQIFRLMSKVH